MLRKYLWKGNRGRFVIFIFANLTMSLTVMLIPEVIGYITNALVYDSEADVISLILRFAVTFAAVVSTNALNSLTFYRYRTSVIKTIETDIASKLTAKLRSLADVNNIYNKEIPEVVDNYLMHFLSFFCQIVIFTTAIIRGGAISWQLVTAAIFLMVLSILAGKLFSKKLSFLSKNVQDKNISVNKMLNGLFSAIRTINIYSAEKIAMNKLNTVFEEKRQANVKSARFNCGVKVFNYSMLMITQYGLVIPAFIMVHYGLINIGQALTLQLLMQYLSSPIYSAMNYKNAMDSTKEIRGKLEAVLNEPCKSVSVRIDDADLKLKNVSFSYNDDIFMDNICTDFKKNGNYLIVGRSGCGKSTLVKLILKELTPDSGVIFCGDSDISSFNNPSWYKNISYVSQKVEIIPGTLRENIVMGAEYDELRLENVVNSMNLSYLSAKMEDELDENSTNFSGGELQRISIARMIYKKSAIFILDEFSSALDSVNAYQIEKELLETSDKLMICISHRLHPDLLPKYDKIFIMESGSIVNSGNYHEIAEDLRPFISVSECYS